MNIVKKSIFVVLAATSLGTPQVVAAQGLKERVVEIKEKVKKVVTPTRVGVTAAVVVVAGLAVWFIRNTRAWKNRESYRQSHVDNGSVLGNQPPHQK